MINRTTAEITPSSTHITSSKSISSTSNINISKTTYVEKITNLVQSPSTSVRFTENIKDFSSRASTSHIVPRTRKILTTSTSIPVSKRIIDTIKAESTATTSKSASRTTPVLNEFLYFNNQTKKFEGVSVQSTFSILKFNSNSKINLTIITTTPEILPLPSKTTTSKSVHSSKTTINRLNDKNKSLLPLYPQFIYTLKLSNMIYFKDNRVLLDILNEQNLHSSQLRVELIKTLTKQLSFNLTDLRLNWIETVNINNSEELNDTTLISNKNSNKSHRVELYDDDTYFNTDVLNSGELYFVQNDTDNNSKPHHRNPNKLIQNSIQREGKFYHLLISFSSSHLIELQKNYLRNSSSKELKEKFSNYCASFFNELKTKHDENISSFKLDLLNLIKDEINSDMYEPDPTSDEYLKKVQFLKLCNLTQIYDALLLLNKNADIDANKYLKNSTDEILFNQIELSNINDDDEDDDQSSEPEENGKKVLLDTEDNDIDLINQEINYKNITTHKDKQLINLKSHTFQIENVTLYTDSNNKNSNFTSSTAKNSHKSSTFGQRAIIFGRNLLDAIKTVFWTLVPEDDFLLAVILPVVIIVAMIVLTIVVTCLLHMCNKEYKELSSASVSTATSTTNSSPCGHGGHNSNNGNTLSKSSVNPIYKQRAYLSKGVPVILYEEMSDKPLEEYDENSECLVTLNHNRTLNSGQFSTGARSPLMFKNQKMAAPAPPEYSRTNTLQKPITSSTISRQTNNTDSTNTLLKEIKAILNPTTEKIFIAAEAPTVNASSDDASYIKSMLSRSNNNNYNYNTYNYSQMFKSSSNSSGSAVTSDSPILAMDTIDDSSHLLLYKSSLTDKNRFIQQLNRQKLMFSNNSYMKN